MKERILRVKSFEKPQVVLIRETTAINELDFEESLMQDLLDNHFFRNQIFSFIGLYYSRVSDVTVVGYPKYIPREAEDHDPEEIIQHVALICRVIGKAKPVLDRSLVDDTFEFDAQGDQRDEQWVNTYDLAVFILQDYMQYGIFYERKRELGKNVKGSINWVKTISAVYPLIGRDVIYGETFNEFSRKSGSPIISPLHIWIINQCAKLLQGLGKHRELETPKVEETFDNSNLRQYVPYILSRLSYVFNDRDVRLLKALAAWCGQSTFYQNKFGTTAFELIWEHVAKQVFGNVDDTKSGSPDYYICNKTYRGRGEAIPDVLRVFSDEQKQRAYIGILDAKYYYPSLDEERKLVRGAPANSDILKQISYYRYLRQQYSGENVLFTNAFLIPRFTRTSGGMYEYIGYVTSGDGRNKEIERKIGGVAHRHAEQKECVLLYQLNPTKFYESYLERETVEDSIFVNEFIVPFQEVNGEDLFKLIG